MLEQQEEIEQKIAQLKQAIISFAPLAKEPLDRFWADALAALASQGISEGIREILRAAYPNQLSPVEIKDKLKAAGQDLSGHKNVMASVHSALKRMLENKEIITGDQGLTYGWRRRFHAGVRRLGRRRRLAAAFGQDSYFSMPPAPVPGLPKKE